MGGDAPAPAPFGLPGTHGHVALARKQRRPFRAYRLIGCIGPAATDLCYRRLIKAMKTRAAPLDLSIVHAAAATLDADFEAGRAEAWAAHCEALAERLETAGAGALAISSIGGHFRVDAFRRRAPLPLPPPLIEMKDAIRTHLAAPGSPGSACSAPAR